MLTNVVILSSMSVITPVSTPTGRTFAPVLLAITWTWTATLVWVCVACVYICMMLSHGETHCMSACVCFHIYLVRVLCILVSVYLQLCPCRLVCVSVHMQHVCSLLYNHMHVLAVWLGIRSKGPTGQYFLLLPCLRLELTANRAIP